jgi:transposase-like protein
MVHTVSTIVSCPHCSCENVSKNGHQKSGKQRWRCNNASCRKSFQLDYTYTACHPSIQDKIEEHTLNSSGVRDTARVLKINKNTVINRLRKKKALM